MSNLLARCITASGSLPAGVLLYRICYWSQYAVVMLNGEKWVAKSASDWQTETTLSPKQYKDAMALLKAKGLIVTSQHTFGGVKSITHVRLTDLGSSAKHPSSKYLEGPPGMYPQGPPGKSLEGQPLYKGDTNKGELRDKSLRKSACAKPEQKPDPGKGENEVATVKELLEAGIPTVGKKKVASKLHFVWIEVLAEVTGKYVPPLTAKRAGQLKLFEKACPPGTASVVLDKVIREWEYFAAEAKSAAGLKMVPTQPSLDFLLAHTGVAVNWATQKPVQDTPQKKKSQTPKPVQLIAPNAPKPSVADVKSILLDDPDA